MKSSHLFAIVIAAVALVWVVSGLVGPFAVSTSEEGQSQALGQKSGQYADLQKVRVIRSEARPYTTHVVVTGTSHPDRQVIIRSQINAAVEGIIVERGQKVDAGELLAKLDVQDRSTRVSEAEKLLKQREIEYDAALSLEKKGFNSKTTLARAETDLENAKRTLKAAQIDLDNTQIRSPFSGVVDDRYVEKGDYARQGDPLYKILNLNPLRLIGFVSEKNISAVQTGSVAQIRFMNGDLASGRIVFVARQADENTRTFRVDVLLENDDYKLGAGLTSEIQIPAQTVSAHRISPAILSLNDEGKLGVKIIDKGNNVMFRAITILSDNPRDMWVSGLPDQTDIVVVGQEYVIHGQRVDPVYINMEGAL